MGHVASFGRSNWRGLSCRAAADSRSNGFRDPAAISSAVNSKSTRLSSCSGLNDRGVGLNDRGVGVNDIGLTDGTLVVPLADCDDDDVLYFVICSLRELQLDAVSSSCD